MKKFNLNDRVKLSDNYVRNAGLYTEYELANRKGTVTDIGSWSHNGRQIIKVLWEDEAEPKSVLNVNLQVIK
jgi:hypothetical protein